MARRYVIQIRVSEDELKYMHEYKKIIKAKSLSDAVREGIKRLVLREA